MKKIALLLILSVCTALSAHAQYAVADGGLYSLLNAQQTQTLNQWASSIAKLQSQLTTAQQQLQTQTSQLTSLTGMQSAIGNPAQIAGSINISSLTGQLKSNPLTQNLQQLLQTTNQAQGVASNPESLFPTISNTTASGAAVTRDNTQYKAADTLDQTYQNAVTSTASLQQQMQAVQADISATEQQMQTAPDQSTVQKLQAKLTGDQAQLQNLQQQVSQANQQVLTQAAVNQAHQQTQAQASTEALGQEMNQAVGGFKQTGTEKDTITLPTN